MMMFLERRIDVGTACRCTRHMHQPLPGFELPHQSKKQDNGKLKPKTDKSGKRNADQFLPIGAEFLRRNAIQGKRLLAPVASSTLTEVQHQVSPREVSSAIQLHMLLRVMDRDFSAVSDTTSEKAPQWQVKEVTVAVTDMTLRLSVGFGTTAILYRRTNASSSIKKVLGRRSKQHSA